MAAARLVRIWVAGRDSNLSHPRRQADMLRVKPRSRVDGEANVNYDAVGGRGCNGRCNTMIFTLKICSSNFTTYNS